MPDRNPPLLGIAEQPSALLMVVYNHVPDTHSIGEALSHVDYLVIIDNSTEKAVSNVLDGLASAHPERFLLVRPDENIGLSRAYNLAVDHARRLGVRWVYFMDHDATFTAEFFVQSRRTWESLEKAGARLGAVVPIVSDDPTLLNQGVGLRRNAFILTSSITSGILTNVDILKETGGFDESLFVEAADFELTSRMRRIGRAIYCINAVLVIQEFECPVELFSVPSRLGSAATRLRSLVRVAIGNANIFRTRLSTYSPRRWSELTINLQRLKKVKGLRRQASIISVLNRLEERYVRAFCATGTVKFPVDSQTPIEKEPQ